MQNPDLFERIDSGDWASFNKNSPDAKSDIESKSSQTYQDPKNPVSIVPMAATIRKIMAYPKCKIPITFGDFPDRTIAEIWPN